MGQRPLKYYTEHFCYIGNMTPLSLDDTTEDHTELIIFG